jgi:hypothetical protein
MNGYLIKVLSDGLILSLVASGWLVFSLWVNPRIFLQDYPLGIQVQVPPKTKAEQRLSIIFGVPFLLVLLLGPFFSTLALKQETSVAFWALWLNAAGVLIIFNLVDWLVLDWLLFCTLMPRFLVIPGSAGMVEYKDYTFHFRGFLHGLVYSILGGLVIAGIVFLI